MRLIDADALLEEINKKIMGMVHNNAPFVLLVDVNNFITNAPTVQREGWGSVPIEPTEGMIVAGRAQGRDNELAFRHRDEGAVLIYKAMIQAAPKE